MGYKFLGIILWRLGKFYLRRRVNGRRKLFMVALAAVALGGAVAAQRQSGSHRA